MERFFKMHISTKLLFLIRFCFVKERVLNSIFSVYIKGNLVPNSIYLFIKGKESSQLCIDEEGEKGVEASTNTTPTHAHTYTYIHTHVRLPSTLIHAHSHVYAYSRGKDHYSVYFCDFYCMTFTTFRIRNFIVIFTVLRT